MKKLVMIMLVLKAIVSMAFTLDTQAISSVHATRINVVPESQRVVLMMHGLHESPAFMKGFETALQAQNTSFISLRLPGHFESDVHALNKVSYQDWIAAAEEAFQEALKISPHVEIIGYSTGGTLATYLALQHPNQIEKLFLISPAWAVSNQVVLGSVLLGWTNLDSFKICKRSDSSNNLCRLIKKADSQIRVMREEDILSSPSAGLQVIRLIDSIRQKFKPSRSLKSNEDYYKDLLEIYSSLQVPLVMINTELDNVVHVPFIQKVMAEYKGPHMNVLFPKSLGISHIGINKSHLNSLGEHYNPKFDEILKLLPLRVIGK